MEKRYACLGLQGITEDPAWKANIINKQDYTVPGFGCDYLHYGLADYVEFVCCCRGDEMLGTDMHFSSNAHWTVWFDSAVDTASTAHKYMVRKAPQGTELLPVRVVCPDVLAYPRPGDELYGQVVAYVQSGTVTREQGGFPDTVTPVDGDRVRLCGRISDVNARRFHYRGYQSCFTELDVETELGTVTVLTKRTALDAAPRIGDHLAAVAYISLDVALPVKRERWGGRHYNGQDSYATLPGGHKLKSYRYGPQVSIRNAVGVLLAAVETGSAFRFGRCCADRVLLHSGGTSAELERWEFVKELEQAIASAASAEEILGAWDEDGDLFPADRGVALDGGKTLILLERDRNGLVFSVTVLDGGRYAICRDRELYLLRALEAALCRGKLLQLTELLAENCAYWSDYSEKREYGANNILRRLERVRKKLDDSTAYTARILPAEEVLLEPEMEDLPGIYRGKWCLQLNQGKECPAAFVFIRTNAAGEISILRLSRDKMYLKPFGRASVVPQGRPVPVVSGLLERQFGVENTLQQMRSRFLQTADGEDAYVWQQADRFMQDWFLDNCYFVDDTQLLEDCIGYACLRGGERFAVYVYAYGERKTALLDGDYCAKLRDLPLSRGRTILVIYLHVTAEEKDGETAFYVGMYGSKDRAPEVWKLGWIGDKSVLLYYPRREIDELGRRLMAAFNARRLDILQTLFVPDAHIDLLEGGRTMNSAVYNTLAFLRREYGMMKTAYVRFNDVVYSEVPCLDGHCYINFSFDAGNRIERLELRPLDESYRELTVTDETILFHPRDAVPMLEKVAFLTDTENAHFSMLLTFENGEVRRYDAPDGLGDGEVVRWRGRAMTNKMFQNGRIFPNGPTWDDGPFRSFPRIYPCVEFINGVSVSVTELYHESEPVEG